MQANWLFQFPAVPLDQAEPLIAARFRADPDALAISTEEAEAFMASACTLAFLASADFGACIKFFGYRGHVNNKAYRRHATLMILKSWRDPQTQEMLKVMRSNFYMRGLNERNVNPTSLSLEELAQAYFNQHLIVMLCHLLRLSDRADQIPAFLASLDQYAGDLYRLQVDVGRHMYRRIVDGIQPEAQEAVQGTDQITVQLRQKSKGTVQVKQEMRRQREAIARQERWRRAKEASVASYLESVRQEIAATEAHLSETIDRQEAEVAALLAEEERQLETLSAESAALEAAFTEAVRSHTGAWPLAGLQIALEGDWGHAERLLIESAGGTIVAGRPSLTLVLGGPGPDGPTRFCTTEQGPAALERLLRRRILPQITRFRPT